MLFEIENIGKIKKASLKMDGITVLAGENSTGKSTIGKAFYCIFNAFYNSEREMQQERKYNIQEILSHFIRRYVFRGVGNYPLNRRLGGIVDEILENSNSCHAAKKVALEFVEKYVTERHGEASTDFLTAEKQQLLEEICSSLNVSNEQLQKLLLTKFVQGEFEGQIHHVNFADTQGGISLRIKGNELNAKITDNECSDYFDDVGILYNAFYIDTPFIMDDINSQSRRNHCSENYTEFSHRWHLLKNLRSKISEGNLVNEVIVKQKLESVFVLMQTVVNGDFRKMDFGGLGFQEKGLLKPLAFTNISAGMKMFLVIRRLLETGKIKERGVLILDEPEIHLHPEWQLVFAELLVLLQKQLDLTILLTTHSPYFLEAVEEFSKKYGTAGHIHYYLTQNENGYCSVQDVTNETVSIYRHLALPFQKLEEMRYADK
ncbi:ABC transporter ATP-binding protein [Planctomycetales bacterium]|nr:ABC transporter ATP-binding protein [Planctomycetales bacterium]